LALDRESAELVDHGHTWAQKKTATMRALLPEKKKKDSLVRVLHEGGPHDLGTPGTKGHGPQGSMEARKKVRILTQKKKSVQKEERNLHTFVKERKKRWEKRVWETLPNPPSALRLVENGRKSRPKKQINHTVRRRGARAQKKRKTTLACGTKKHGFFTQGGGRGIRRSGPGPDT